MGMPIVSESWQWTGGGGYLARPDDGLAHPGVMVFMDIFGLGDHARTLAQTLASFGYCALVPDILHGATYTPDTVDAAFDHLRRLRDDAVVADTQAAVAALSASPWVAGGLATFGVCNGGRLAVLAQCRLPGAWRGGVSFYGGGMAAANDPYGRVSLITSLEAVQSPLLLLYGADDRSITPEDHAAIVSRLSSLKKRYTLSVFPDAGHAFLNVSRPGSYAPEAARAGWQMASEFLRAVLPQPL